MKEHSPWLLSTVLVAGTWAQKKMPGVRPAHEHSSFKTIQHPSLKAKPNTENNTMFQFESHPCHLQNIGTPPCACTALSKHGVGVEPPF